MKTLTIKLTAPLQSYGNEASFSRRTTTHYPTKSAVIGMVAAALGYRRSDQRILALNDLSFAVRIDQAAKILTDYQTVEWKKDTRKITYRDYLQDAVFMVALGSQQNQLIDEIQDALRHPHFQLFLGRRSNAPAGVLQLQVFTETTPLAVLEQVAWQAAPWYQKKNQVRTLDIVADANLIPTAQGAMIKDQVESFDQRDRRYGFRAIAKTSVSLNQLGTQAHDIMGFL
ncbi:type I-E CRISPR-associated protein Cas5/CasD [Lactobacillus sp. CBA3605]|uniref:type I-E CRISPR-associated protein Cas5/CasD n=1 Tax=Lactobacillus sp. CBA3605 TaxID=2099788 RepID=UPI000CFDECCF|nr:type I-E CRISPR-associated protein Cas5/CasD [Lactobacillus sp. CBA3605]AVK61553.1 type I-E CRISPR-associated protein Cas5/CasD [Lactobacillus sp. CBA3605]